MSTANRETQEEKIAQFLKDAKPSSSEDLSSIRKSRDLFQDGWIDSLLQVKLLTWLEKEFSCKIPAFGAGRKNFLTVQSIAELVTKG